MNYQSCKHRVGAAMRVLSQLLCLVSLVAMASCRQPERAEATESSTPPEIEFLMSHRWQLTRPSDGRPTPLYAPDDAGLVTWEYARDDSVEETAPGDLLQLFRDQEIIAGRVIYRRMDKFEISMPEYFVAGLSRGQPVVATFNSPTADSFTVRAIFRIELLGSDRAILVLASEDGFSVTLSLDR